jgi:hypothetical protein
MANARNISFRIRHLLRKGMACCIGSPTPGNSTAETALAGLGARIRTWEWRNQNPSISAISSTLILKKWRIVASNRSIGYGAIQNNSFAIARSSAA